MLILLGVTPRAQAWTVSLTVNKPSPQPVGTQITLTATTAGAWGTPTYTFLASTNNGSTWSTLRPSGPGNQFVWTPSEVRNNWLIVVQASITECDPADPTNCSTDSATSPRIPFSTDTAVAGVTLSANRVSGQPLPTTVTWTASPSGGYPPVSFKWLQSMDGGATWTTLRNWTSNANQYVWTPPQAGTLYLIRVAARSALSTNPDGDANTTTEFLITGPAMSNLTLTPDRTLPQPAGTAITWTAAVTGGIRPYIFGWQIWTNGSWTSPVMTSSNRFTWTPPAANADYQISVSVWSATDSPEDEPAERSLIVPFSTRTTVTSLTVAPDKPSGQPLGTAIVWTATPTGGTAPISYKWRISIDGGATWTTGQDWTAGANRFTWTPSVATSLIRVSAAARSAGSTSAQGEATVISANFTIVGPPVSSMTLTPNKASPQAPGTAITWTAAAIGGTAPIYYYWTWTDGNGGNWGERDWSTSNQLVWTPSAVSANWIVTVAAASANADLTAITYGSQNPEATAAAVFSTASTVLRVALTADRSSGQPLGTTVNWTATPTGGTAPFSYRWMVSSDDGVSWTLLQDWTTNANRFPWTPTVATSRYQIGVWVRSAGSTNVNGEATNARWFVISDGAVRSLMLSANRPSPQVTGTPIAFTATPAGGTAPIYYEWLISSTNGGAWAPLRELSTSNQLVWTPQDAGSAYRILVNAWSYDADFDDSAQATAVVNYVITPRISGLTLTASRRSPQPVNTAITWTAAVSGGTPPVSYRWKLSTDAGTTWTLLQDWTANATQRAWTPTAISAKYLFMVSARSVSNADPDGESTAYASFVVTNASGALVTDTFNSSNGTLLRNRTPEVTPPGMTWTITGSGDPTIQSKQAKPSTGGGYQFASVNPGLADAIVAVDVIVGSSTRWGGLVLRLADINNFLVVRYASNLQLTQVQAGQSTDLAYSTPPTAANGSSHRLEARLQDDRVRVYWDGLFQFEKTTTFQQGITRHGLAWNLSSSTTTLFDNFDLRPATIVITGPGDRTDFEETNITAQISATDSQAATLTYSATGLPPELTVDASTGAISGYLTAAAAGPRTVTLRASAGSRFAERTMQWLVLCPANDYALYPYTLTLPSGNGSAEFWVLAPAECPWQAVSQNAFITVDSSVQHGTKPVQVAWPNNNPGAMPAVGSVKVAGRTVIVSKAGTERFECRVYFSPVRLDFNADGGSSTVTFAPADPCQVLIASEAPWIHVFGRTDGFGSGSITVSVDRNLTGSSRTGAVAIASTEIVVDQVGDQCTFDVEHYYFDVTADPESHDVQVYAPNGCGWDAWSNNNFIHITEWYPSNNPAGNGHIRFSIENNPSLDPRIGTLTIAGRVVTIFQHGIAGQPHEDVQYYHLDAIGSVRMITDTSAAVVSRHDYLPFGTEWSPPASSASLRFAGKERDATTGYLSWGAVDNFGARYYAAGTGRFISVDPLLDASQAMIEPQRWNRYTYALNNPLRKVDPDGRDTLDLAIGFAQGIAGNVIGTVKGIVTTPYALATDFQGTVSEATAAVSDHLRLLRVGVKNPSLVWDAYAGLALSQNDADQRMLGAIIGGATATTGFALASAGTAAERTSVTVVHYTDAAGKASIEASRQLRAGTWVTKPGEVSGLNAAQIESKLEIRPGRGQYSATAKVKRRDLYVPSNGPRTSEGAWQRRLKSPCEIPDGGCVQTPD